MKAAKSLLLKEDVGYQEYLKNLEEQARDTDFRRQGELLASVLREKFDAAIAGSNGVPGGAIFPPAPPSQALAGPSAPQPPAQAAGFTPAQLERLKSMMTGMFPVPPPQESLEVASKPPPGSKSEPAGALKPLQIALVNSMFGGRVKVSASTTLEEFSQIVQKK